MNRTFSPLLTALLLSAPTLAQSTVDNLALGKMWTFENPPLAYLEKEYGFKPDQHWLDSLRLAALRLGERDNPWCSASFVSPRGLIMTNHHCVREQIAAIQGEHEWVKDGFAATAEQDEVKIPGLTVQQLVAQEDVTAQVNAGVALTDDDVTAKKKRDANIEKVKQEADKAHPGHLHQVVSLYQGAVHQLYRYRVYDDLRLVCAPDLQTPCFGGDPDNFTYPRWSIDFAFVRAYENDKPADTSANYFRWRQQGALENDLVFVPGNPGNTDRQMTVAQLEAQRDVQYPLILDQLKSGMAILWPYTENNSMLLTTLLSWENSNKAIGGMLGGLRDEALMKLKRTHEEQFRAAVAAKPELQSRYGKIWDELSALAQKQRAVQPKVQFYVASYSGVLDRGLAIAKALDETLDEKERDAAREEALKTEVRGNVLTEALLVDHFERASKWLPAGDPYLAAVGGAASDGGAVDWHAAVKALDHSKLAKTAFMKSMLDAKDGSAWQGSDDLGVVAARTLYPLMRAAAKEEEAVSSAIEAQGTLLGQALFAVFGTNVSPDATMTLRFSDGLVEGYPYNGTIAPWATTFYGLYGRSAEFGDVRPFNLSKPWLDAEQKIDLSKRVCFVSTNDIVGGNSGSCVVDRDLKVVGLIFDGNIESLPNDFYYTQTRARAVSVHTDAILVALQDVYGMGRIVEELRDGAK